MAFHFTKRVNKLLHKMKWYDFAVLKIDLIIAGLLIAKFFPHLTEAHRGWYVAFIVAAEFYFYNRLMGK